MNAVRGMSFSWSLNPYMGCAHRCTFCYVRGFERRADRPADDRYGESVRVKVNVAQVLAAELSRPSWAREEVVVGAATDPYQPAEGRYRLTRECIRLLAHHRTPFSIITRGPLVVRDRDVLAQASRRVSVAVNLSIPTLDDRVWRTTEPGTAPPRQRLRALRMLRDAGIRAGVALAPILPGLSDSRESMAAVVRAAREAGAAFLWADLVNLRPGTREHFLERLARDWPAELARYRRLFAGRAYLPSSEREALRDRLAVLKREIPAVGPQVPLIAPEPMPVQLALPV
ncbi:MAG: radical SAM protein [Candidatus Eiseniibacteriota bacterium]